ncbi:NUDIX domain-containing protein [Streptomyces gamaensis]|uniref:NUDIX domain-containing protein n=1 Tax=Streptomyces gamaensis TaxID=1763542 RepID=A0ABW0Z8J4_9ACTN
MTANRVRGPGCLAMVLNGQGEILLQLRDDTADISWPGHWSLPGGGREPGEAPLQTILRELTEETGISPEAIHEFAVSAYEPPKTPPHVFIATWTGDERGLIVGEGQALRFFPLDRLPEKMPPHMRHYLRQLCPSP